MKSLKTVEPLVNRLLDIQRINSAASVLSWDQETYMPAVGGGRLAQANSHTSGNCASATGVVRHRAAPWHMA